MDNDSKKQTSQTGMTIGSIAGAGIALLVWFLFLRSPHGGYFTASENIIVIVLAVVFGALGAWAGSAIQSLVERNKK